MRALIEELLADGPVPMMDILQAAEERGISQKTLNRAKSAMGVGSFRRAGKWYWEQTIEVDYTDVEDGQSASMATLTILPGGRETQ